MKILIDNVSPGASTSSQGKGGMRMYLENLLGTMLKVAPEHQYKLLTPHWNTDFNLPKSPSLEIIPLSVPRGRFSRVFYEQTVYPFLVHQLHGDVFLGLCNNLPLSLRIPSVVVIQSTQFQFVPESYSFLQRNYLRFSVARAVKKADAVITVSEDSKKDIVGWTKISADKVFPVHHGCDFSKAAASLSNDSKGNMASEILGHHVPFILCVSSFYPYKNLFRLIDAFRLIKTRYALPHHLVMIGDDTSHVKSENLISYAQSHGVGDSFKTLGKVPHSAIASFYKEAAVLVMPSLYETFGLPVLEAMALDCPVVTSRVSSMPEVAGEAAELVDPYDTTSIAEGMGRVLTQSSWREELIRRGKERVKKFTWEASARKTLEALNSAVN